MNDSEYTKLFSYMQQQFMQLHSELAKKADSKMMELRFDAIDRRFDGIDIRIDGIDLRLETLESDVAMIKETLSEQVFHSIGVLDDQAVQHEKRIFTLEHLGRQ